METSVAEHLSLLCDELAPGTELSLSCGVSVTGMAMEILYQPVNLREIAGALHPESGGQVRLLDIKNYLESYQLHTLPVEGRLDAVHALIPEDGLAILATTLDDANHFTVLLHRAPCLASLGRISR